ncbi:disease resistance-like protein DSC1 [Pyrus communis]|uniref:disease resistance-like protein DSC1 n=1 Tax=Pyrus communis TaxID=23211 RepID=UPI0035BEEAC0
MAASSSSAANNHLHEKYDVFLSFRGEDTRNTFTSHLHAALCRKKIKTYIDDNLERGDEIAPALMEAITKSNLSVIIFSENYAFSTWCLGELVHILRCKEEYGQCVIPIFYSIDPSHVRNQQGTYGAAFSQLEERFQDNIDKVLKWRAALTKAANLAGFDNLNKTWTEADLVDNVVEAILTKLSETLSDDLKGLVGIESRINDIKWLLCNHSLDVLTVGIWGMGGIGKTTLADAVFNQLSRKFEASCFLANMRKESEKHEPNHLRNKLLRKILNDDKLNIDTPSIGSELVKRRLLNTKVLIVLDDVNDSGQLELLVGDQVQFGPGSRIIITTRDRRILKEKVDKIYEVKGLTREEALQLFHLKAFKNNSPGTDYAELLGMVVDYAEGMPLALKILGSSFLHCKSKEDWEAELNKLKKFPSQKIHNVLRLSYDGLEENEKEIFLDIACFYRGSNIDFVKRMSDSRGLFAAGIGVLVDMSLIKISSRNCLEMHDLLQEIVEIGRSIVREQCIEEPGKRNRLCIAEDAYHVLKNNTGTAKVQGISFNTLEARELDMSPSAFEKMYNLRVLQIYDTKYIYDDKYCKLYLSQGLEFLPGTLSLLRWDGYPLKSLPSKFSPENLVELRMPYSKVEQLWTKEQNLGNLKVIDLSYSTHLTELPDLSKSQNLESMNLYGCTSLVLIPSVFRYLGKLTYLNLGSCWSLNISPGNIEFLSLVSSAMEELPLSFGSNESSPCLILSLSKKLKKCASSNCQLKFSCGGFCPMISSSLGNFSKIPNNITVLDMTGTTIEVFPSSIERFFGLTKLELKDCQRLVSLPTSICKLKSLERLDLSGCSKFEHFPEILEAMGCLTFLGLEGTAIKELPSSIGCLISLIKIELENCKRLASLPTSICKLKSIYRLSLNGCLEFEYFPEILEPIEHLKYLSLERTAVKKLPLSIGSLVGLETLYLGHCKNLEFVPNGIYNLNCLKYLSFDGCLKLQKLPPFSVGLCSLVELNLSYCSILEITGSIFCLASLRSLYLCGTMIDSIPASIKQALQLRHLYLINCSRIHSLPELPILSRLHAHGCISLKTISSSKTALSQGWDEYEYFPGICEEFKFSNCPNLSQNSWSNLMDDALIRIMRMATATSNFIEEEDSNYGEEGCSVIIVCPGNEIPNWFSYQNEGCSLNIKLPPNWFGTDFLGFALSLVVTFDNYNIEKLRFGFKSMFKTNNGESHEFNCRVSGSDWDGGNYNFHSDHVFVWYNALELVEGAKCSATLYNVTEASVHFYQQDHSGRPVNYSSLMVKKCGICLLYTRVAEKIIVGEDTISKRRRDETEAWGSDSFSSFEDQKDELLPQITRKRKNGGADC